MTVRATLAGAAALVAALPALAVAQGAGSTRARTLYEDLQMVTGVLNQIRVNHPDSVDQHALIVAAIRGMLGAADPHSYLIVNQPLAAERAKEMREGKLIPVPVHFAFVGGSPVVVAVAPGSSAARADILPGDELVAVDGRPVDARSADELELGLAGRKGSAVRLAFERQRSDGTVARVEREVKREKPGEGTAVPVAFMLDATTGYARITTFDHDRVADDLHERLGDLEKAGMRRLVLDLRDNGGGSVKQAADAAGEFLPRGAVVYTTEGRKKEVADTGRVGRSFWSREKRYPIVLLVNSSSASASELVAGALQDHDRALVVGRPTFGKSLVMQPFPLPDGSLIWMVTGHMKTPCGRVLQRQYRGITSREYYRGARAERDTIGRPSCRTSGGRTVFGGGGVYPDVVLPEAEGRPSWLARAAEELLPLRWVGAWTSANAASLASLDALAARPELPAALADFRQFAERQGVAIPAGADADARLARVLLPLVADARWGDAGYYRMLAVLDPEVKAGTGAFERAEGILGGR